MSILQIVIIHLIHRIIGDATGEIGPFYYYIEGSGDVQYHSSWYGDCGVFVYQDRPWFLRGGHYSVGSFGSQFYFDSNDGNANNWGGFRIALAVK